MNSHRNLVCDWFDCDSAAPAHFIFGMSATGRKPAVATHGNLCHEHKNLVNKRFTSVLEYEIGGCPDRCSPESVGLAIRAPDIGIDIELPNTAPESF